MKPWMWIFIVAIAIAGVMIYLTETGRINNEPNSFPKQKWVLLQYPAMSSIGSIDLGTLKLVGSYDSNMECESMREEYLSTRDIANTFCVWNK